MNATEFPHFAAPQLDLHELRIAFGAVCDEDFSGADLEQMTAAARRHLEACTRARGDEADALRASMLRELLELCTGRDESASLH